jgi:hypothetical protein
MHGKSRSGAASSSISKSFILIELHLLIIPQMLVKLSRAITPTSNVDRDGSEV